MRSDTKTHAIKVYISRNFRENVKAGRSTFAKAAQENMAEPTTESSMQTATKILFAYIPKDAPELATVMEVEASIDSMQQSDGCPTHLSPVEQRAMSNDEKSRRTELVGKYRHM
jgi:hypothetical protein